MIRTKLGYEELNKRASEVFDLQDGDEVYDVAVDEKGNVKVTMEETGTIWENFRRVIFDYEPDMANRPEALDYLLGNRVDFND